MYEPKFKTVSFFRVQGGNPNPIDEKGTLSNVSREIIQVGPNGFIEANPAARKLSLYISDEQHALMFFSQRIIPAISKRSQIPPPSKQELLKNTYIVQARFPYWVSNLIQSHAVDQSKGSRTEPSIVDPSQKGTSYGLPGGRWVKLFMESCLGATVWRANSYQEMKEIMLNTVVNEMPLHNKFRDEEALYKTLAELPLTGRDKLILNTFGMNVSKIEDIAKTLPIKTK